MHLVDQPGPELLLNGGYAPTESDVGTVGTVKRPGKCLFDPSAHKVEGCPALHSEGCSGMMVRTNTGW